MSTAISLQSCLEFSLRIQEFIELIRQNKRMDAVRYSDTQSKRDSSQNNPCPNMSTFENCYESRVLLKSVWRKTTCLCSRHARKHFSQAEGGQLDEVRQVMGMLAFPSDTHISPYKVRFGLQSSKIFIC